MLPSGGAVRIEAGVTLFREGEPADCAYYVERGEVEVSILHEQRPVVVCRKGPGELFGEMALIEGGRRSATAATTEPCDLIVLTRGQLLARLDQADPALRLCVSLLMNRLRWTIGGPMQREDAPPAACTSSRHSLAAEAVQLQHDLEQAVACDRLELHYQPIIDMRAERVAGFEALVRWRHPTRGLLYPAAFLPGAEASGLVSRIDAWVLGKACRALRLFRASAPPVIRDALFVGINVSACGLAEAGFADRLRRMVKETGVPPGGLKLEITERLLMSPDRRRVLEDCRNIGASVALDDFGSGYSSLAYLHRFPIDTLKLDRSFLEDVRAETEAPPVLQAVLHLARSLGLPVIAEGIESAGQASLLVGLGASYGQGFHFSHPLPLDAAQALLGRQSASGSRLAGLTGRGRVRPTSNALRTA